MIGIGFFPPIPTIHADTQGKHEIKFNIAVDIDHVKPKIITVPDEQVYRVGKNGTLVIEDFSAKASNIFLNEHQMEYLIVQNASIRIVKGDITLVIPLANFSGKHALTLTLKRLDKDPSTLPISNMAVGAVYDITLKWGDQLLSLFDLDITLSFPVQDYAKPEELQVYYWNEEIGEWELIGGKYKEGYIHALTSHFGVFALFHPINFAEQIDKNTRNQEKETLNDEANKGSLQNTLPNTSTNIYNFIVIGIVLLLLGSILYFLSRRFKSKNVT